MNKAWGQNGTFLQIRNDEAEKEKEIKMGEKPL
jgi:hypothetical protein